MGSENGGELVVKVQSVLSVVSSTPVDPPDQAHHLSPMDRAMARHSLHVIFYFKSSSLDFELIRPALNEVLSMYPNVTGRLAKDGEGNWEIRCTDAGVRVYRAMVGISVDEWLRSASSNDEKCLSVWDNMPDDPKYWAPFRLKVTDFKDGGTAISLSCPHMLADPISLTLLIKSWAEAYRQDVVIHPPFLHPQALSIPPTFNAPSSTTPSYYASKSTTSNPNHKVMVSATFDFSDSSMKQSITKNCPNLPEATPFDLLTGLFWMSISKLKTQNNDLEKSISICTDMRKRFHAPLPYGYFGNALHFSQLKVDGTTGGDLGKVTELVHQHVAEIKEDDFWSGVEWFNSRKDDQGKFLPPFEMYGPDLTFVNMESMIAPIGTHVNELRPLMYGVEFSKDQKPTHVSYHVQNVEGEGLILVMPSPKEGLARRVTVTLPEDEIENLLKDPVILSLDPTLLLSGKH